MGRILQEFPVFFITDKLIEYPVLHPVKIAKKIHIQFQRH